MPTEESRFVDNHKGYTDAYQIFCRTRGEQQKVWVEKEFVPKLRDVFITGNETQKSEFKILAVGTNIGSFDIMLIDALFSYAKELVEGKQVSYTVVDLNTVAIGEFKRRVSSQGGVFQNINFNWVNMSVEEFLETNEPERYDLIQFVHVLYFAENEEQILKSAYEKFLASPGCILAVVAAENNIWVQVVEAFKMKIPSITANQLTNAQLSKISKRNAWEYEMFDAKLDLEVTEVFDEGNSMGQAILKIFFHMNEEPNEKLGKMLMSDILELFRRVSWEKMRDGKKCLYANEDDGALLIYKRS